MKKVAISKSNSKFHNYVNWIEYSGYQFEILDWEKQNFGTLNSCSSLFLTGGADIFPEFYADWQEKMDDNTKKGDYIPERDGFEFRLVDLAFEMKIPVLAVCRGMQLINCRLNGSLLSDIETIRGVKHTKLSPNEDRYHGITVNNGSLLSEITGCPNGTINSSHHQGIDRVGEGLMISARAEDGIVEAIEWDEKTGKSFFLGIQWHPERMNDQSGPFVKNILERFLEETDKY